ncbi:hypothetical protein [Desulfogranum marinum]|uniref:hypothetical protein n=1 Tax=Desulfogranum marinum TaxID=453220 RepID=UPI0029C65775|nr:hypothetical protein [Desulfogranum marinum]
MKEKIGSMEPMLPPESARDLNDLVLDLVSKASAFAGMLPLKISRWKVSFGQLREDWRDGKMSTNQYCKQPMLRGRETWMEEGLYLKKLWLNSVNSFWKRVSTK